MLDLPLTFLPGNEMGSNRPNLVLGLYDIYLNFRVRMPRIAWITAMIA